ncbi:glycosyltransferase family 2 protein [Alicyclobacillus sp. ALC3]|uniref:glycosyltransferase family 2 protein n=1 Tax=Alicyclobacillus sp. ALC3 TaxID=2796143 RepID=UPI002378522E|nr:glycosyltransferase family 2 protein [Alicyclobacillus sp. ALC3]WDL95260.1 glycosyltransferase family 2 protein [Alicyclobacillus sp. ALC3]
MSGPNAFRLSVCICTRNRPTELMRALQSLSACQGYVHQVVVSDDSTSDETCDIVKNAACAVQYVRGPKRGLGANRNHALRVVTGTHILFVDDDVFVESEFVPNIIRHYEGVAAHKRQSVIVTGLENKQGELIVPHEQSFLGFQKKAYGESTKLRTIVINSTVFPAEVFAILQFDEQLVYGYDEVDIATRASYTGFEIELCPTAINSHYPSELNRSAYRPYIHASRLYVTFKRYWYSERRPIKALLFVPVAVSHLLTASLLHHGIAGATSAARTIGLALSYSRKAVNTAPWMEQSK